MLFFVIGASGAGKTATLKRLATRRPDIAFRYADTAGVPSQAAMIEAHGTVEAWQRHATVAWVRRIKAECVDAPSVMFDMQTRPSFIAEACASAGMSQYRIVLMHCADAVRNARLTARGQPELANSRMADWARFLRDEAARRRDTIIDTTDLTIEDAAHVLESILSSDA